MIAHFFPDNLSSFDLIRVLRNVIKSELKKLATCESYFYILFIINVSENELIEYEVPY